MLRPVTLLFAAVSIMSVSCVSSKKFKAANAEIEALKSTQADLLQQKANLEDSVQAGKVLANAAAEELNQFKQQCESDKADLVKERNILTEERSKLQNLKSSLEQSLSSIEGVEGIEVSEENGKLYIRLGNSLLYPTGSAIVSRKGKNALGSVVGALKEAGDVTYIIVGGTDDKPFRQGGDNWTLSTERANSVVRVLSSEIDPTKLTASGKGEYNPVADNTTAEGRAKNRRTEIVVQPNLERVWSSIQ